MKTNILERDILINIAWYTYDDRFQVEGARIPFGRLLSIVRAPYGIALARLHESRSVRKTIGNTCNSLPRPTNTS
jgi:hypothetical protein